MFYPAHVVFKMGYINNLLLVKLCKAVFPTISYAATGRHGNIRRSQYALGESQVSTFLERIWLNIFFSHEAC